MKYVINDAIRYAWDGSERPPEQALIEWAKQFVVPGSSFIDCGAHVGSWSFEMAELCSSVLAFEAQRETFYRLCAGIVANGLEKKIQAERCAIGAHVGQSTLAVISQDGGGSSTCPLPTHGNPLHIESVLATTLDQFIGDFHAISFIKIDVEGAELDVMRGAASMIQKHRPRLIFECWNPDRMPGAGKRREELFDYVSGALGYRVTPINHYSEMFLAEPP